jgi:hypothetical protein
VTPLLATVVLTALSAVVVILTRVRLARGSAAAGRLSLPPGLLNLHTCAGAAALVGWVLFLVAGTGWVGALSLVAWWATAVAGLMILTRWLPAKGRHSSAARTDTWGEGPGLSVLAHVGLLVGVCVFTVLFLTDSIP